MYGIAFHVTRPPDSVCELLIGRYCHFRGMGVIGMRVEGLR